MKDYKISIAVPSYKGAFLKECIESVLAQTYKNFELLIVDDCSPEDLYSIVEPYLSDTRVKYSRNEKNCGAIDVVDNWNICLSCCSGDYVICMGDDDKLLPNCLQDYIDLINKYPGLGLYHGWTEIIDENSEFINIQAPRVEYETVYSMMWNRMENRHLQFIGDYLFNVDILRQHGGFYKLPQAWASDDISAYIAATEGGVANTHTLCFQYRVNSQTISSSGNISLKIDTIHQEKLWYESFLNEEPSDIQDKKYYKLILRLKDSYFNKKYGEHIAGDINRNIFRIFKWYRLRKRYGYGVNTILYAIYFSIKEKNK